MILAQTTTSQSVEGPWVAVIYMVLIAFFAMGFVIVPAYGIYRSLRDRRFGWTAIIVVTIPMFFSWIATIIYAFVRRNRAA